MCSVSMIMDHQFDEWSRKYYPSQPLPMPQPTVPYQPFTYPPPAPNIPLPSQEEVEEFRRLLDRAREYDRTHNQPDCELEEKRQKIKDLAEQLGVDVSFV